MQISLTARHCDIGPELRQFAAQRLEKLHKFARDIREAHVIVTLEKYRHTAEITLRVKRREMVSTEVSDDAANAIDLAADRLEEQLRRLKERRLDRKQRSNGVRGLNGRPEPEPAAGGELEFED